jgi:alkanesulfonate monooxygenase SsuD/methylene tetrahydromethanopterin reductase-like flavin-dependent oxidoreductase (luciferase family)
VLLKMVNTLDILAGGRAYLGIGAAWYQAEARGFGIPYPSTSERFELLEENLQLAKALWASDEASFEGKHIKAPAITNNPRPLSQPHPRIMVGGTGPNKTLRMVAQYADACNIGAWVGPEKMQASLDRLKEHCDAMGRDYDSIEKSSLGTVFLSGTDTVDGVLEQLKGLAAMGFTHAIFNMPDAHTIAPIETFGREVIPAAAEL